MSKWQHTPVCTPTEALCPKVFLKIILLEMFIYKLGGRMRVRCSEEKVFINKRAYHLLPISKAAPWAVVMKARPGQGGTSWMSFSWAPSVNQACWGKYQALCHKFGAWRF